MLINKLRRLFQYFTPVFVNRNKFLEVLDAFQMYYNNFYF